MNLRYLRIATDLLILFEICLICECHFSLLSSIIPKNLHSLISLIVRLFISIEILAWRFLFVKIIMNVLFRFMMSLFAIRHSKTLLHSIFITSRQLFRLLELKVVVESSAYCRKCKILELFFISLTYIKNNKGPRIEPWGTPIFTSLTEQVD